jgi:hypothetical protein
MIWARMLAYVTGMVNQELLLRKTGTVLWSKNSSCPLPYARTSLQAQVHDKSGALDPLLGPVCTHPYIYVRLPHMTRCPYLYAYAASRS